MNFPLGTILVNQREVDTGLGSINDLHLRVLCTQIRLDPTWVSLVDLNVGALQFSSQMHSELIQRRLRSVVGEGLERSDRALWHRLQGERAYDAAEIHDAAGLALLIAGGETLA